METFETVENVEKLWRKLIGIIPIKKVWKNMWKKLWSKYKQELFSIREQLVKTIKS